MKGSSQCLNPKSLKSKKDTSYVDVWERPLLIAQSNAHWSIMVRILFQKSSVKSENVFLQTRGLQWDVSKYLILRW